MESALLMSGVAFGRNCLGIVTRPYETYRRIVDRGSFGELGFIGICLSFAFATAALVRTPWFRPLLLTGHFVALASGAAATFLIAVGLFWRVGSWLGAKGKLKGFSIAWGYTLMPTLLWFLATSLLYVIVPPPRTMSKQGIIFSLVYLVFSATMLFWKVTLGYLSLRFGLRLSLGKILMTSGIVLPVLGVYSFVMYRMGIFRIPFL